MVERPPRFSSLDRAPVVAVLLAAVLCVAALQLGGAKVPDPDVFWIAAAGRDFPRLLAPPTTNGYSFVDGAVPWVFHERLFAPLYAAGLSALGPSFFSAWGALVGIVGIALVFGALARACERLAVAAMATLLVLFGARSALFQPRPAGAALVLFIATLALASAPWSRARAAALLAVALVWTNAHGSFPLAAIATLAIAIDERATRRKRLGLAVAIAALGVATPYGLRLPVLAVRYVLGGNPTMALVHRHILEFAPLWRAGAPLVDPLSVMALVASAVMALSALRSPRTRGRALFVLLLVGLAVRQARHGGLACVAAAMLLHGEIERLLGHATTRPRFPARLAVSIALPAIFALAIIWSHARARRDEGGWLAANLGGRDALALLDVVPNGARLYVPFDLGGLVLWRAAPRGVRVFYDSRNDCYAPENARVAFAIETGAMEPRDAVDLLRARGATHLLVADGTPIAKALGALRPLARQGAWSLVAAR